jgi:hypothetical protein
MDHVEVLMRLLDAAGAELSAEEIQRLTHVSAAMVARALFELAGEGIIRKGEAPDSFRYAPVNVELREAVAALATMYHQKPVTLVKLVYSQPPTPLKTFSDAFRLRDDKEQR